MELLGNQFKNSMMTRVSKNIKNDKDKKAFEVTPKNSTCPCHGYYICT